MCGIAGIFDPLGSDQADVSTVRAMLAALRHRGPDGEFHCLDRRGFCAGCIRLAIVDRKGGTQPYEDESGSVCVLFNGEITNHRALRRELARRGHRFEGWGDGEVIPHLYQEDPTGFVSRLDGMFAFALWDAARRRLVLARDRCGIKPLVTWREGRRVIFASEIKALLGVPEVRIVLDRESVARYLAARFVPGPETVFEGIRKVEPGCMLIADRAGVRTRRYWNGARDGRGPTNGTGLAEALEESVRRLADTDLPLGLLLSGGLDSSGIGVLLPRRENVTAFTVGYAGRPEEDERHHASRVAEHLGLRVRQTQIIDEELPELLDEMAWYLEEPIYTPVTVSTFVVSRLAAEDARVVLSGDGADELLFGYEHMRESQRRARRGDDWERFYVGELGWMSEPWRDRLIDGRADPFDLRARIGRTDGSSRPEDRIRSFEFRLKLPEYHLNRVDRLSMAFGLEVRVPYLGNAVVRWALQRAAGDLARTRREKQALRSVVGPYLPGPIRGRRKKKFSAPAGRWLCGPLHEKVGDLVGTRGHLEDLGLSPGGAAELLASFRSSPATHTREMWGVFVLLLWYDRVFKTAESARSRERQVCRAGPEDRR